jgi:beta-barrel assembly-enhancing protease
MSRMFVRPRRAFTGLPHWVAAAFFAGLLAGAAGGFPAAAASSGADDLPMLGDASSSRISPELERQIGTQFLQRLHAALPTVNDPILKYWVNRHITDLAQHSQLRDNLMQVVLIDNREINAFAAPGGVVGINLGLILAASDIHEYSSVIAHELAHLSQRHFARGIEEQRAQTLPTVAGLLAAIMIGAIGGGDAGIAAMTAAQAASQNSQLRYSRAREQEADRIGLGTMMRAGLDPAGMSRMFESMQQAYRFSRRPPEFLLTHPLSESRVADARQQVMLQPAKEYDDSPDYALMRARAMVHFAESPQAAVKQFDKAVKDDPDSDPARYGLALALSELGQHKEALAFSDALVSQDPTKILYVASYAEILTKAGQLEQAERLLSHHLTLNPDNAPLAMLYADALTKQQKHKEAAAVLARQSQVRSDDVDVWYNLAEVSGLAGDIIGVHRARAEFFALHGGYQKAIHHLEYARRLADRTNTQLLARLDQRIDDFRTALRVAQS